MRRFALLVLLLSCAACARKAQPVADGGAPALPVVAPPRADAPPPVEAKPKKALDPKNFAGKSLAQWREDLRSKDRHKIISAMKACEALGPLAADAIPDILAADIDEPKGDDAAAWRAHSEFHAMKSEVWPGVAKAIGKPLTPHLLPLLDAPDAHRSGRAYFAIAGLGAIGPDAGDAIPKLSALARQPQPGLRDSAASALVNVAGTDKRAVPGLLGALKAGHWGNPRVAATLARLDPEGSAEECIAALTANGKWDTKSLPVEVFVLFGSKGVAAMVAQCKWADGNLKYGLVELLSYAPAELLSPHANEIVKWFDTAVKEKGTYIYFGLLRKLGSHAKEALPQLLELARSGDLQALAAAARAGATWQQVSPLLRARKDRVAEAIAEVLPAYGPQLKGELAPFVEMLKAAPPEEKGKLAAAILHCDPTHEGAAAVLLETVVADKHWGNNNLALVVHDMPPAASAALCAQLKHGDERVRYQAARAVLMLAPDKPNPEAVRLIATNVTTKEDGPSGPGTWTMIHPTRFSMLIRAGDTGVAALGELLTNNIAGTDLWSARTLANAGERAGVAAPALLKCLETGANPDVIGYA